MTDLEKLMEECGVKDPNELYIPLTRHIRRNGVKENQIRYSLQINDLLILRGRKVKSLEVHKERGVCKKIYFICENGLTNKLVFKDYKGRFQIDNIKIMLSFFNL